MSETIVSPSTTAEIVKEFIAKLEYIENEIKTLEEDKKTLFENYKEKLDMKVLKIALRVHRIEQKVDAKSTYEEFKNALSSDFE